MFKEALNKSSFEAEAEEGCDCFLAICDTRGYFVSVQG
jgi:hypothetical protein